LIRVLAVDTSTRWGGVALVERPSDEEAPRVVAEAGFLNPRTHADSILDRIDWLLARAGWSKQGLDGFVSTRGPGSFTGIRVSLGTVAGLGLAADRPCAGVGTLEALAEAGGPCTRERMALIGAGRGEVYGQRFDGDSAPPEAREEPWVGPPEGASLEGDPRPVLAPGGEFAAEELARRVPGSLPPRQPRGLAGAAGRIVLLRGLDDGGGHAGIPPLYVRPPDAVVKKNT